MQPLPVRNAAPHEETGKLSARGNGQRQDANINHTNRHVPSTMKHNSGRQTAIHRQQAVTRTACGAAIAGAGDLLSAILRYMTNIVMTHIVSPSVYGTFIVAYTVVTVIGYTAKFGLDSAMLRFLSAYQANNKRALALGLVRFTSCLMLVSGLIAALVFYLLSAFLAQVIYHEVMYEVPFKEAALLIPLIGAQLVIASGLQALKAIKWKVYVDRLIQPGVTLFLLIIFFLLGLRLEALLLATTCGFIASTVTGYLLVGKKLQKLVQHAAPRYKCKTWLRFALPMSLNSMIRNILNSTDVLFLGALAVTSQVGLYGAADRVSYFVVAPLIALNVIFSPIIAEYHARQQHRQLASLFKVVTRWSFSLSLPIFLCCLIFHDAILGIFGAKYIVAGPVLILLALGNLADAGAGSVNYLLTMTGRPGIILANTVATVIVNIILILLFVPRFTIVGAALAAALTVILLNSIGLVEVYYLMHMQPYDWRMLKPIIAGIVASLAALSLKRLIYVGYGLLALPALLALITLFTLIYISTLIVLRLNREDKMVIATVCARLSGSKKNHKSSRFF